MIRAETFKNNHDEFFLLMRVSVCAGVKRLIVRKIDWSVTRILDAAKSAPNIVSVAENL